ncbi:hypothetical protein QAD02_002714 [Eretmocerus hayati]|uniref:Uncharacterized protein n=1 Tax=Eretmocerus hayati TaxID=131215 RepID=A0ACC2NJQ1_9HYME|nr:hypothetical protein QAD02_002714 [Eretmocerus hayati]
MSRRMSKEIFTTDDDVYPFESAWSDSAAEDTETPSNISGDDTFRALNDDDTPQADPANKYLRMLDENNTQLLDTSYGVRKVRNTYMIGNKPVSFDDSRIHIDNDQYEKTNGLIQLLFKKHIDSDAVMGEDLGNFNKIMQTTSLHRKY